MKLRLAMSIALSMAAAHATTAFAQTEEQKEEEKKTKLEAVVVYGRDFVETANSSGTKSDTPLIETPQSISIISRDLLESWGVGKLTEALRYTPGVNSEPFGIEPRFTSIRLRGFTANTEALFRDGLALRNPLFIVSYNLEPYGAERIEIPRGPASALYGLGSPGGIINYISKTPTDEQVGEVGIETDNRDRKQVMFDVGGAMNEDETVSFRLTGLYREGDTQIDFVPDDRQYFAGALQWDLGESTSLTFLGSFQQDDAMNSQALPSAGTLTPNPNGVVPVSRFTGEPTLDKYDRGEYSVGYQFEHQFNDNLRFLQNARLNDVDLDDIVVFSTGFLPDLRTMTRNSFWNYGELSSITIDNQLHLAVETGSVQHKLLFGVDWQDADGSSIQHITAAGATPNLDIFNPVYGVTIVQPAPFRDAEYNMSQLGFYAQDEIKIAEKFIVNLAVRYDDAHSDTFSNLTGTRIQDQDDTATTYRVGAVYRADNGLAPYVSYGESYYPSVGVDAAGNPFDPETGEQWEVGLKYQPQSFDGIFTIAYFDLTRANFVTRNQTTLQFEATGQGSTKGIEVEAYASFDNGLSVIANYNDLTTNNDVNGNPALVGLEFTQIPDTKASAWLDYKISSGALAGLGFGAGVRYQSSTFSDALNTISSPGFTLYDAAVYYEVGRFRIALNVQNLEDKIVQSSCFVRNQLLCTFGETRALRGSVRYRWGD